MRTSGFLRLVLFAVASCGAVAQSATTTQPDPAEPKRSQDWFRHASERMTLRSPGSKPFHLGVRFHAFAGEELLAPGEKTQFMTGDGTYDETWLEPHHWQREVTLADYHGVEAESNGTRKMHSSSDYEPSRVLMLIDFLFTPIEDDLTDGSLRAMNWKIDHVSNGALSLVRLSKVMLATQRAEYSDSYYFLPNGDLAMNNVGGVVALWSDTFEYEGKVVAMRLTVKCGERELLTADISVDSVDHLESDSFDLAGGSADPGMTLRKLQGSEVKIPDPLSMMYPIATLRAPSSAFSVTGVLDRTGAYREVEVLLAPDLTNAVAVLHALRTYPSRQRTLFLLRI
jgi:hypothetical protein